MISSDIETWAAQILMTYTDKNVQDIDIRNTARIMLSLAKDRDQARMYCNELRKEKYYPQSCPDFSFIDLKIEIENGGSF